MNRKELDGCVTGFFNAYIEAMHFTAGDSTGETLSADAWLASMSDCIDFIRDNFDDLQAVGSMTQHGHDFWFTRNGHGTGFWDRGYSEIGERLSKASKVYCGVDVYTGDDGLTYLG